MRKSLEGLKHYILFGCLVAFALTVGEGPDSLAGRLWWMVGCGLALLWQPVFSPERRPSGVQIFVVLGVVFALVIRLDWMWFGASTVLLAALIGGKVMLAREKRLAWFYLLAFAFVCLLLFVWISPRAFGSDAIDTGGVWSRWLASSVLISALVALPKRFVHDDVRVFDLLASVLILLVLSSILMAAGLQVALSKAAHLEALARALLALGGAILLLNWLWNPRLGFSGIGPSISRYLLRFGFPFEEWLGGLSELFDREGDPEVFFDKACESFLALPWVVGGDVVRPTSAGQRFGREESNHTELVSGDLRLRLFTAYPWSSTLVWQANLLFRLVVEFYRARQREHLLRQMQYIQAVYETGSRVTHDVKNLLQSMEALCFALEGTQDPAHEHDVVALMRRQLPTMSRRLRATLEKLAAPKSEQAEWVPLSVWWEVVQQRSKGRDIGFAGGSAVSVGEIPRDLFDNVVENLLANAIQKRLEHLQLRISVMLETEAGVVTLRVSDDGDPVPSSGAKSLFEAPVPSVNGLGIGLYHAAKMAAHYGYRLALTENRVGSVVFTLNGKLVQGESRSISG